MAGRREEGCYEKTILTHVHVCKGPSNDDVGAARGTIFQEIRLGSCFKTVDFVKEKLGGGTVEQFVHFYVLVRARGVVTSATLNGTPQPNTDKR